MTRHRWVLIVGLFGGLFAGIGAPVFAEDGQAQEPESITMRGKTMQVWPSDDLRARGFDIPDIPREANAFWIYLEAINAYKDVPPELRQVFDYAVAKGWPVGSDEQLRAYLLDPDNQRAFDLARQAAAKGRYQSYYFGNPDGSIISVLLPSLRTYRELSKLLVVDGRRREAQGDFDGAMSNYVAVLRMGHDVGGGITLIESLVGIAVWAVADHAVSQMVLRPDLPAEQLAKTCDLLDEVETLRPSMVVGLTNERLFGMTMVDDVMSAPLTGLGSPEAVVPCGSTNPAVQQSGWCDLKRRVNQLVLPDRTIKQHMIVYYDECIRRAQLPAYEARWHSFDDEAMVNAIPRWDVLAHMLLPSLSRAAELGERCRMVSTMTRLAVALRLYMTENNGRPPLRLDELSERFSAEELIDPFSGREYGYQAGPESWRLYSIDQDMVDDGGTKDERRLKGDYVLDYPPDAVQPFVPVDESVDAQ